MSTPERTRRPWSATVLALLVALLLSGCVSMPTDGPVVETRSRGDVTTQSGIYIDPPPPQKGESPPEVVLGFLYAMTATPIQTTTAKQFLTEDAAASWDPQQAMITYATKTPPREVGRDVTVRLNGADRLDSRGAWQGPLPPDKRTVRFPMAFEDGQWRIDGPPNALIVPESWFEQRFRQVSLYFFDPTASILVPEPVFVPRGVQLATTLTQALLKGPGPGLEHVSQTFIPPGLQVAVSVAVADDGVADIALKGDARQLSPTSIGLMAAQFAWTLRQESSVEGLRIFIDGEPVQLPGGAGVFRVDGAAQYDPAGYQASPLLYGLDQGKLVSGTVNSLAPVGGPFGTRDYGLRSVAVDLDASRAAGVSRDGTRVLVGSVAEGGSAVRQIVSGARNLLPPAWDFADRLWLVDRTPSGARVSYVEGGHVHGVRVDGITGQRVTAFLVSRDGSRLVAVVRRSGGDVVVASRIEHRRTGLVVGATPAERVSSGAAPGSTIRDIAWLSTTSVAVLQPFNASLVQVGPASVDGSPVELETGPLTVEKRLLALAGSPVPDESLFGITPSALIDLSRPDPRVVSLDRGLNDVGYVG